MNRKLLKVLVGIMIFATCCRIFLLAAQAKAPKNSTSSMPDRISLNADEQEICKKLHDHISMLATDIGARSLTCAPDGLERAAVYIEQELRSYGLPVSSQSFNVSPDSLAGRRSLGHLADREYSARNIIAELRGTTLSDEVIIVGAHYDSDYDCPAANDNGSGVAAMLEIARLLAGQKLQRTVRFVGFVNEEMPFFGTDSMGSYRYARECHERGDKIVGMYSLETMGYYTDAPGSQSFPFAFMRLIYPGEGNFIAFVSNLHSRRFLKKSAHAFKKSVDFPCQSAALPSMVPRAGDSDHWSFWQFKYPAVMVTDTAPFRYPHYHAPSDTADKIDYERMSRVVFGLSEMVQNIAGQTN